MTPLPDVPNVVRVDYGFIYGADAFAKCRYFVHYSGTAPNSAECAGFATQVNGDYNSALKPLANVDVTLDTVTVTDLSSATGGVGTDSTDRVGTRAGDSPPASACVLQSLQVPRRYRGGHPRVYWPFGVAGDLNDPQHWAGAFIVDVNSGLASAISDTLANPWSGGGSLSLCNVSYFEGFTNFTYPSGRVKAIPARRVTPMVDLITDFTVRDGVASQRGRLLHLA